MKERIKQAVEIAETYRQEHDGEIPSLVVAHTDSERFILVGKFRPDKKGNGAKTRADQKQFASVCRIVFEMRGVKSYEVITKPDLDNASKEKLQLTQNLLSIFSVDKTGTYGEFYEIEEDKLTLCRENLKIGSWYANLLPTKFKVELDPKTMKRMEQYIKYATYKLPVKSEQTEMLSGLAALAAM